MKRTLALGVAGSLLVAFVLACYEFTGPSPAPDLRLTGAWTYESQTRTPGGGYGIYLTLRAAGGKITGAGEQDELCCFSDSLAVSGDYSDTARSFELRIRYSRGPIATYAGQVFGADSLSGTWTGGATLPRTFYRQPDPPCADSAPLLGTYDPAAPGYIVRFQDSVDATAEAARLAERYGFTTTHVYQLTIKGFAADLSRATVAVLRCEPKVTNIEYDAVFTTAE